MISATDKNEVVAEHALDGVVFHIVPSTLSNATLLRVDSMSSSLQVTSIIK